MRRLPDAVSLTTLAVTTLAGLALAGAVAAQVPAPAKPKPKPSAPAVQTQRCTFQVDNVDRQGSVIETPTGTNYFAGGNVRLSCRGQRISMQSDSVAAYGGTVVQFIGNVKYRDSTLTMDADFGTYYKVGERWEARGRVATRNLKSGSSLTGPSLDYFREVKGVRDTLEMYAVSRPKIRYFAEDSAVAKEVEPYIIVADRVRFKGSDRLWGGGKVTIDRSDFAARGDSLRLDTGAGSDGTLIGGEPTLRGLGPDSFQLSGRRIDMGLERRELKRLVAKGAGHAVNRDWDLVADTIVLDLKQRKLEQTLAWGKQTRPFASSPQYAMRADSLALDTPGQKLREVRGFGAAWLGGDVDSVSKDRDWMKGDTLVAQFAARDSAGTARSVLSRIVARRGAQSYHLDHNAKAPLRPSINYARGDAIVVTMRTPPADGVERVDIRGKVDGVQLEAAADSTATPADTVGRKKAGR
jgi:hypothetical protein